MIKECRKCGQEGTNFGKGRRVCNPCRATQRDMNKNKEYRMANREERLATSRAWAKANPDKHQAGCSKARAKRAKRAVELSEASDWMIKEVYHLSQLRTEMTGVQHEVDHIVPLCGKNVSGLHVPWNLQVLTRTENRRKYND